MAIPIRRIVGGIRPDGNSGLVEDRTAPHVVAVDQKASVFRTDIWASSVMPYDNSDPVDPTLKWPDDRFEPLPEGTSFFVMQIPPDTEGQEPFMHSTETLDYVIILRGEAYLLYEDSELLVKPGDIIVQKGARHAWSNRSDAPCLFAAVMIDARLQRLYNLGTAPMTPFETQRLPVEPIDTAPDGTDVRAMLQLEGGSFAHFELPPGRTSFAVTHKTVDEIWYILSGKGEMWRKQRDQEEVVPIDAGVCLTIPLGTHFQFRSFGYEPLVFVVTTMPPWPGKDEGVVVEGYWKPSVEAEPSREEVKHG